MIAIDFGTGASGYLFKIIDIIYSPLNDFFFSGIVYYQINKAYSKYKFNLLYLSLYFSCRYGIAPKFLDQDGKPRIEVFNPCDDSDD